MSHDPYILITADTHAGASVGQYRDYLEARYHDAFDDWRRNSSSGEKRDRTSRRKLQNWDREVRTEDQNSQGVVGEVVFPNTVPPFYPKSVVTAQPPRPHEYELRLAGARAASGGGRERDLTQPGSGEQFTTQHNNVIVNVPQSCIADINYSEFIISACLHDLL